MWSRSIASGPSTSTKRARAAAARSRWAARLPGPKAKSMTSGGRRPSTLVPVACRSVTSTTVGPFVTSEVDDGVDGPDSHERQVDRHDQDGLRATRDDVVTRLEESGVEAGRALAQGASPEIGREVQDLAVRADDHDVGEPVHGQGGHHGPPQEARHEVVPLLGIQRAGEPGLGALERPDRDDRGDARHQQARIRAGHASDGTDPLRFGRRDRERQHVPCQPRPTVGIGHDRVGHEGLKPQRRDRRLGRGVDTIEDEAIGVRGEERGDALGARFDGPSMRASGRPGP